MSEGPGSGPTVSTTSVPAFPRVNLKRQEYRHRYCLVCLGATKLNIAEVAACPRRSSICRKTEWYLSSSVNEMVVAILVDISSLEETMPLPGSFVAIVVYADL